MLLYCGGSVSDQFELVGMRLHVLAFEKPPKFNEVVARARAIMNVGCDMRLHGRYAMEGNRPVYVMLPLGLEDECQLYKTCARDFGLKAAEVVAEVVPLPGGEMTVHGTGMMTEEVIANPIVMEQMSHDEWQPATHRVILGSELAKANSEAVNLALVRDEFDGDTFDPNPSNEQNVDENDESSSSESDEEITQAPVHTGGEAPVDTNGKGNESTMA
jgi:hypothetical protein